jgi:protein involved in polysaccharide export with SLBB domain
MTAVPAPAMTPPMTMAPAPVAMMAMPMNLFGRQLGGFVAGGDCGMSVGIALRHAGGITDRLRRQRCCLRSRGKGSGSRRNAQCKFQKVPALHNFLPRWIIVPVMQGQCRGHDMNRS